MNKASSTGTRPIAFMGIPFANADITSATRDCIQSLNNRYTADSFYVSSYDTAFFTRIYGWRAKTIRNTELLSIARSANLSLLNDKYLRVIARCLGSHLAKPFTSTDLLASICDEFSKNENSIFLLGGTDKATKAAAIKLHDIYNGIRLVGIATPPIFVEGDDLANSRDRDALLLEQINSTQADMLVVNLGSPKQEIWFERVRHQLKIPLVVTINDLVNVSANQRTKAAHEEQKTEVPKQPKSLSKLIGSVLRRAFEYLKVTWMALPLVIYHTINQSVFQWFHENKSSTSLPQDGKLFLSAHRSIASIALPQLIDHTNVDAISQRIDEASSHDVIVLDFLKTRHIQPEGFYLLIEAWIKRQHQNKEIYGFRPISDIKCLMKMHRTWDIFKDYLCPTPEMLLSRLSSHEGSTPFFDTFTQQGESVVLSIIGALDHRIDYETYQKKILPIVGKKDCMIDLSCCTLIDNSGFAFLLYLQKQLHTQGRTLGLLHVNKTLREQFKSAKVESLLHFN